MVPDINIIKEVVILKKKIEAKKYKQCKVVLFIYLGIFLGMTVMDQMVHRISRKEIFDVVFGKYISQ